MKLREGKYYFGDDISVEHLAEKYSLPLYVYESSKIKSQYNKLVNAFNVDSLKINYACKALTNINILALMKSFGSGLDTVSIQEIKLGLMAGFSKQEIIYTPNCVSVDEMVTAIDMGVKINIDNISFLEYFGQHYPDYPICIRINPHIMAGGNSKISVGHMDSKFGISIYQMPLVKRIVDATGIKIEGLHMHTGSDILDSRVFMLGAEILLKEAKQFDDLSYIDFGSGFKVSYKSDGIETDVDELGIEISNRFNQFCKEYGKTLTLMFEPGKYLVSEAGSFLARVNVVKQTTANVFAGIDSGLNHFIRPMFYDAYHEIINLSRPAQNKKNKRIYTVVGYICETDTFGINRKISEISEGDILCMKNAGAYCYSMSSNYNSRYRPAEVLIHNNQDYLIRKRETFEDLVKNQVELDILKPILA